MSFGEVRDKNTLRAERERLLNRRSATARVLALRFDFRKHAESIPAKPRPTYLKSQETHSLASAIKAKCQECTGYEDYQERIQACSTYRCPLWKYRPYQDKGES